MRFDVPARVGPNFPPSLSKVLRDSLFWGQKDDPEVVSPERLHSGAGGSNSTTRDAHECPHPPPFALKKAPVCMCSPGWRSQGSLPHHVREQTIAPPPPCPSYAMTIVRMSVTVERGAEGRGGRVKRPDNNQSERAPVAFWDRFEQFVTAPNGALLDGWDNVCRGSAA